MADEVDISAIEKALKERYVLVSWATLSAILVTAGVSTIGGAWIAARGAIESSAAKQVLNEVLEMKAKTAEALAAAQSDRIQVAEVLRAAENGKIQNLSISGVLNAGEVEVGTSIRVGGGTGIYMTGKNNAPSFTIGHGGHHPENAPMVYSRTMFSVSLDKDGKLVKSGF